MRKPVFGVSNQVRHNPGCIQPQKMARGLKFRIWVVEGLYYPYSEKQTASLFSHMQKSCFHMSGSYVIATINTNVNV